MTTKLKLSTIVFEVLYIRLAKTMAFLAKYSYNTSFHTLTQMTPFEIVYNPPSYISSQTLVASLHDDLLAHKEILCQVQHNIEPAWSHIVKPN